MNRIITLLLAAVLAVSLCACGDNANGKQGAVDALDSKAGDLITIVDETADPEVVRADYEKGLAYVNSLMDSKGMTQSDQDDEGGTSLYHYWSYDETPENADFPMDITLDGTKISIGTTKVSELRDAGMKLSISEDTVQPNTTFAFTVEKAPLGFTNLAADNSSDKEADIYTLPITEITVITDEDNGIPFDYCNLGKDSDLKAVLDAFGTPNYNATLSSGYTGVNLTLEYAYDTADASDILSISMIYDPEENTAKLGSLSLTRTLIPE